MNFRADIYADPDRLVLVRHYEAKDQAEALENARQETVAAGLDHADVWIGDGLGGASYLDTVSA